MKVVVIKDFRDKETGAVYEAGDEIEVTAKRFAAINKHRRGPLLREKGKEDKPEPPAPNAPPEQPATEPPAPDSAIEDKPEPPAGC